MAKKRVFHFDINGTIILFDSTDKATSLQAVGEIISKNIYGTIENESFVLTSEEKQQDDMITYYQYLRKAYPTNYKQMAYDVLQTYPQFGLIAIDLEEAYQRGIFQSLFMLIDEYPDDKFVFRTFGTDGEYVTEKLQPRKFIKIQSVWICAESDKVSDKVGDKVGDKAGSECQFHLDGNPIDLNELILSLDPDTHILVQDDYETWLKHSREKSWGKIIHPHEKLIQYGFDDNPCMHATGDDIMIHKVNPIEAATNEYYYIGLVAESD